MGVEPTRDEAHTILSRTRMPIPPHALTIHNSIFVLGVGLEPTRIAPHAPKACAYTNFATPAAPPLPTFVILTEIPIWSNLE